MTNKSQPLWIYRMAITSALGQTVTGSYGDRSSLACTRRKIDPFLLGGGLEQEEGPLIDGPSLCVDHLQEVDQSLLVLIAGDALVTMDVNVALSAVPSISG